LRKGVKNDQKGNNARIAGRRTIRCYTPMAYGI
jgi:hypothetical protein